MVDSTTRSIPATRAQKYISKRSTRYASSRSGSASTSFNISRPPVILEMGSSAIRVGYAEQFKPQHIIPFKSIEENQYLSESEWYSFLSPIISEVFDRLMIKPSTRRVVCVHQSHPQRTWERALQQHLWNRGVPAITMVTTLEMIPVAQGWKRGLVVEVSGDEAVCVAHVDGHILPFTFQRVPCGYKQALEDPDIIEVDWSFKMEDLWLSEDNPNSLLAALLKCLEACPIDVRRYVAHNIVFTGEGLALIPDIGRRIGAKLKKVLGDDPVPQEEQPQEEGSPVEPELLTVVPVQKSKLKALVDQLGITSCAPYRPDLVAWVGTNLWASVWYKYDDDETRIKWTFAPTPTV